MNPDGITLTEAIAGKAEAVTVICDRPECHRSSKFPMDQAIVLWGAGARFGEIARRSKCRHCGRPATEARPSYPRGDMATRPPTFKGRDDAHE